MYKNIKSVLYLKNYIMEHVQKIKMNAIYIKIINLQETITLKFVYANRKFVLVSIHFYEGMYYISANFHSLNHGLDIYFHVLYMLCVDYVQYELLLCNVMDISYIYHDKKH